MRDVENRVSGAIVGMMRNRGENECSIAVFLPGHTANESEVRRSKGQGKAGNRKSLNPNSKRFCQLYMEHYLALDCIYQGSLHNDGHR
jgi:hypothetical protein